MKRQSLLQLRYLSLNNNFNTSGIEATLMEMTGIFFEGIIISALATLMASALAAAATQG